MKQLRVALVVKNTPSSFERDKRNMGYWSYAVPEFTWEHFTFGKGFVFDTRQWEGAFDLVFHEDGGNWGEFVGSLPVVYLSIDSTLSEDNHYKPRFEQAKRSTLVLVDHDDLNRFKATGKPAFRFPYCVNDLMFSALHPDSTLRGSIDVSFHCAGDGGYRGAVRRALNDICLRRGWKYTSGVLGLEEYAHNMRCSKVVVNWPRAAQNRPHRIFDAMASGAAVLTGPIPPIKEDLLVDYTTLRKFASVDVLEAVLEQLIVGGEYGDWERVAECGRMTVQLHHTWSTRARQLRELLHKELGL